MYVSMLTMHVCSILTCWRSCSWRSRIKQRTHINGVEYHCWWWLVLLVVHLQLNIQYNMYEWISVGTLRIMLLLLWWWWLYVQSERTTHGYKEQKKDEYTTVTNNNGRATTTTTMTTTTTAMMKTDNTRTYIQYIAVDAVRHRLISAKCALCLLLLISQIKRTYVHIYAAASVLLLLLLHFIRVVSAANKLLTLLHVSQWNSISERVIGC